MYVFGPVPSRRLGLSLGVDLIPMKTCTLSCRYCQIGRTPATTIERKSWVPLEDVLNELRERLGKKPTPDWITFSGSGEPTLNSDIGYAIESVKALSGIPVCVITNGTLLWMPEVRAALAKADTVMPSLDSAVEETFRKMCQPHESLTVERVIDGLVEFRNTYRGRIWLEIMLMNGVNDSDTEIEALQNAVNRIRPDAVHLNTVVRPPADTTAKPVPPERLLELKRRFGPSAVIIAPFSAREHREYHPAPEVVREYLKRRPGSADNISMALGADASEIHRILAVLEKSGDVRSVLFQGEKYWEYVHENR